VFEGLKKVIKNIKHYGLTIRRYEKVDILILDENNSGLCDLIDKSFSLDYRNVNLYYLLKCFFFMRFNKKSYIGFIINDLGPRIIIFHHLSYSRNWCLDTSIVIVYQFCLFNDASKINYIDCDYFLIINELQRRYVLNKTNGDIVVSGAIKSNIRVRDKCDSSYDIVYISEYRGDKPILQAQIELLRIIRGIQDRAGYSLGIAYNSLRPDKKGRFSLIDEMNIIDGITGVRDRTDIDSYAKCSKANIIICHTSNLGFELLSHGYKVIFYNNYLSINQDLRFCCFDKEDGLFWIQTSDADKLCEMIENLMNMSDSDWESTMKTNYNDFLSGDKTNSVIKKLCK